MKLTVLLGVLLLGGVGIYLWSSMGDEGTAELDPLNTSAAEEDSQPMPRRRAAAPRAGSSLQRKASALKEDAAGPGARSFQSTEGLDEGNSLLVEVVHAGTDRPFGGETLSVLDPETVGRGFIQQLRRDPLRVFRTGGTLYRLSREGRVRIPLPKRSALLVAFNNEFAGMLVNRGKVQETLRMEVERIQQVRVRVLNSAGEPLKGLIAQIGLRRPFGPRGKTLFQVVSEGETDVRGLAGIPMLPFPLGDRHEGPFLVTVSSILRKKVQIEVREEDLFKEVIDVIVPAGGSVTVNVLDEKGRPFDHPMTVMADIVPEDVDVTTAGRNLQGLPAWEAVPSRGTVRMQPVDLGLRILVHVLAVEQPRLKPLTEVVNGPGRVGESVTVTLQFKESFPTISGRILDVEGHPVRDTRLDAMIVHRQEGGGSSGHGIGLRTDAEGRFSCPVQNELDFDFRGTTHLEIESTGNSSSPGKVVVSLPVAELMHGSVDLGDLVLAPPPLLAAGTVYDEDGAPLMGAEFALRSASTDPSESFRFKAEITGHPTSGKDGSFEILGTATAKEFRLTAHARGYLALTRTVQGGSRGVDFVLSRGGAIKGRLVLEGTSRFDNLMILLAPVGESASLGVNMGLDGSFEAESLAPGKFEIRVHNLQASSREPLARFGPFEVLSGDTTDVGELAFQVPLHRYQLELIEPGKLPRNSNMHVTVTEPGSDKVLQQAWIPERRQEIVVPAAVCNLTVFLGGYRELQLRNVTPGKVPIRLTRGIPVRIRITNSSLIPRGLEIKVKLRPQGAEGFRASSGGIAGDVVYASHPGKNIVSVLISKEMKDGGRVAMGAAVTNPGPIEVADTSDLQTFDFTLDEAAAGIVLAQLKGL